ncbi:hypothetical protein BC939DRAFT_481484 [Gamsiella multidivaricata]|uniref:uncharacterized protein n=1 Tax=Gamsiella multidivaricata TaxID=101098 RepID=UPI00222078BA|nr:uncharacterized protein BC939DRAFT_481484 [Gamsiella multidivaricata]KAG0352442.1 hypothetical protein BGZ54_002785 [Gamsiella multidivaricata]KAI7817043.1 hypothetical protein BC939DRAFT_481484 [Gamsiella multidivaricata]
MHPAAILIHAALVAIILFCSLTLAQIPTRINIIINATPSATPPDKPLHWEVDSFPSSIAQLKEPLDLPTHTNVTINATSSASPPVEIFHWEVDSFPSSIAQLRKPLHLTSSLIPGKNPFDIVADPILKKSKGRVLRSLYPAHSYAYSGDEHAAFTAEPLPKEAFSGPKSRYIRLEYQMLFKPGFNWVLGGKLPGILLGSERGCNAGCSGGGSADNCFSTRMMWRPEGEGELYLYAAKSVYFPKEKAETCKRSLDKRSPKALFLLEQRAINPYRIPEDEDEFSIESSSSGIVKRAMSDDCLQGMGVKISPGARNLCNPAFGVSIGRGGSFKFKAGTWHNITQIVRLNSKGKAIRDGYLAVYLDNKPVIQAEGLVLLKNGYEPKSKTQDNIVKFKFSSFFGGHTAKYATPNAQWIAWKGFKMATSVNNIWK